MPIGPIEAVRVFTSRLEESRRFYAETLGLPEKFATDFVPIFDTGQAKLIVEHIDDGDPEANGLVGRFTAFSFTVKSMETALSELAHAHNAVLIVDAAQSAVALDLDVRRLGVDFLSTCAMKWLLGAPGVGFLYVARLSILCR